MGIGKDATKILAIFYIVALCTYSSILVGTLTHELMHKRNSLCTAAIEVNYDGTGQTEGYFYNHGHEWVYFNGFIIEIMMVAGTLLALLIIIY